ncbi:hypothetical protein [Hyphomonas sp.]|uniref:hypothetical protein n=1 Tax=Hyphomonas sp. TaxID=87 RepID=UPI00391D6863
MLDGFGIYGCSYSPAHITDPETASWSEVCFFVLYSGPSRNQLGRFVQRLLTCGQNRVFLQPDFVEFKIATLKLKALSDQLDRESLECDFKKSDIDNIRQKMKKASDSVRGGIEFRVGRTQRYWNNLQGLIANIRSVRIIGWQTYDDYIMRTYGSHVLKYEEAGHLLRELEMKIFRSEEALQSQAATELARSAARIGVLGGIGLLATLLKESINQLGAVVPDQCSAGMSRICQFGHKIDQDIGLIALNVVINASASVVCAVLILIWFKMFLCSQFKRFQSRRNINAAKRRWTSKQ